MKGEDLIREGGEVGSEKDTEQARKHVGEALDPSPEPEGTTRLRKMIIRIQVISCAPAPCGRSIFGDSISYKMINDNTKKVPKKRKNGREKQTNKQKTKNNLK